jgi:hypothetical protein
MSNQSRKRSFNQTKDNQLIKKSISDLVVVVTDQLWDMLQLYNRMFVNQILIIELIVNIFKRYELIVDYIIVLKDLTYDEKKATELSSQPDLYSGIIDVYDIQDQISYQMSWLTTFDNEKIDENYYYWNAVRCISCSFDIEDFTSKYWNAVKFIINNTKSQLSNLKEILKNFDNLC